MADPKEGLSDYFNQESDLDKLIRKTREMVSGSQPAAPAAPAEPASAAPEYPAIDPQMARPFIGTEGGSDALKQLRATDPRLRQQKWQQLMQQMNIKPKTY